MKGRKERRERINRELGEVSRRQGLPYRPGISMGYAVSDGGSVPVSEAINRADGRMYMDKKKRKAGAGAEVLRDSMLALTALGFAEDAARKMVQAVLEKNKDLKDAETVLRMALAESAK